MRVDDGLGRDPLGRVLLRKGLLTAGDLELALERQRSTGERLGEALQNLGIVGPMDLVRALAAQNHIPTAEVGECVVDPRVLSDLPEALVQRLSAVPAVPLLVAFDTLFVAVSGGPEAQVRAAAAADGWPYAVSLVPTCGDMCSALVELHELHAVKRRREGRIGDYLVRRGFISQRQLDAALDRQRTSGEFLGEALVSRGDLTRDRFFEALSEHLGMPFVTIDQLRGALKPEVARTVSRAYAEKNQLLPFAKAGDRVRVVATGPIDEWLLRFVIQAAEARDCEPYLASPEDVRHAIAEVHEQKTQPAAGKQLDVTVEDVSRLEDPDYYRDRQALEGAPKLVNFVLNRAVERGASDIHIEHQERSVVTRFRVDGELIAAPEVPIDKTNVSRVVAKLKLDARLDITEHRRPQDGSFRKRFGGERLVDFRLSVQPTVQGENVVVRVLDRTRPLPLLGDLGFAPAALERYLRLVESPQGLILFTGPTGSGKTTSLYATLDVVRRSPLKIITAEDPVEYFFDGIQQCQVNETIGNGFATFLRSFLRQDPDVILVGEMRDTETAEVAIRAALTGHLVFTTLHTNDGVATVTRLIDMGVEPDLVSGSLLAVVSQRLVRTVCKSCARGYEPSEALIREFYPDGKPAGAKFVRGGGCDQCGFTGYRGRRPVFELWEPDEESRALLRSAAGEEALRAHARQKGMRTMVADALEKVDAGLTTLEELRSTIPLSQIVRHARENRSRLGGNGIVGSLPGVVATPRVGASKTPPRAS
jgi:type IV pilus assembly protein PilB